MRETDIAKAAAIPWDGDQSAAATVCRVLIPWFTRCGGSDDAGLAGKMFANGPVGQRAMAFRVNPDAVTLTQEHGSQIAWQPGRRCRYWSGTSGVSPGSPPT